MPTHRIRLDKVWEDFEEKALCPDRNRFELNTIELRRKLTTWTHPIVDPGLVPGVFLHREKARRENGN